MGKQKILVFTHCFFFPQPPETRPPPLGMGEQGKVGKEDPRFSLQPTWPAGGPKESKRRYHSSTYPLFTRGSCGWEAISYKDQGSDSKTNPQSGSPMRGTPLTGQSRTSGLEASLASVLRCLGLGPGSECSLGESSPCVSGISEVLQARLGS